MILFDKLTSPHKTIPEPLNGRYINSLDGIRALSILIVVLGHFRLTPGLPDGVYHTLDLLFAGGELGVRIFFVLSGFLITSLLIKEHISTGTVSRKRFYMRRFLRIFPVFYFFLIVAFVLNKVLDMGVGDETFVAPFLYVSNFTFLPSTWMLGHSWSLSVEEQYYLLWPLVFSLGKRPVTLSICIIVLAPILRVIVYMKPEWTNVSLSPFINSADSIFAGSLLSFLIFSVDLDWSKLEKHKVVIFVLGMATCLFIYSCMHRGMFGKILLPFGPTISTVIIALIILTNLRSSEDVVFRILNNSVSRFIGRISYSMYMWQQVVLIPEKALYRNVWWNYFPLNIVLILGLTLLSYYVIERYFNQLKDRFLSK